MILYVENPKDSTPKLLELIQQFSNVAGYKINAQKSVALLYTNNVIEEREIKESIPFTIAPKTIRYLGIKVTKEAKDLYSENYRIFMKEIEEDAKKWKKISFSWIGIKTFLGCPYYPKQSTHSMQSLSKYHQNFSQSWKKLFKNLYGTRKDLKQPK